MNTTNTCNIKEINNDGTVMWVTEILTFGDYLSRVEIKGTPTSEPNNPKPHGGQAPVFNGYMLQIATGCTYAQGEAALKAVMKSLMTVRPVR